jgi:serine phosphatase RsbU (regulator of sigma subunit)
MLEASAELARALDTDSTLQRVVDLAVPRIADWCVVHVQHGGAVEMRAVADRDPNRLELLRELYRRYPIDPDANAGAGLALREGKSVVYAELDDTMLQSVARDEHHLALIRQGGTGSIVAVPMQVQGVTFGVLVLGNDRGRPVTRSQFEVAEALASRAAVAIERARLFAAERAARARAEHTADRLRRLQTITATLARAATAGDVANAVISLALPSLGSAVRALWVCDREHHAVRLVGGIGFNEDVEARYREMSLDDDLPVPRAIRTATMIVVRSLAERDAHWPQLHGMPTRSQSWVTVPLITEDDVVGAITLGFIEAVEFDDDDLAFFRALGDQCAQALERSRLLAGERTARERLAFLSEASAVLATSLDYSSTLAAVVRLAVPRFADVCLVHLNEDGRIRRVALAHVDPAGERRLRDWASRPEVGDDRPHPLIEQVAITGRPYIQFDGWFGEGTANGPYTDVLESLGARSVMILPLLTSGTPVGAITFIHSSSERRFSADTVDLGAELARRTAVAVDNARVHRARTDVAISLQRSLLPPALPTIPGVEVAAAYRPTGEAIEAGGDFYDVFPLGDRWGLVIGDVCGTGPVAAATTALVRHTLRAEARHGGTPVAAVAAANDVLLETGDDEQFCTVIYGELTPATPDGLDLALVAAGHPPPFVVRGRTVTDLAVQGPLLGVFASFTAEPCVVHLDPGDAIVLVTDGVLEARAANDSHRFFGREATVAALLGASERSAAALTAAVEGAVASFTANNLEDDMAVLVLRAEP